MYYQTETYFIKNKKRETGLKINMSTDCIWRYFVRGKTHDLYGLLTIIVLNFLILLTTSNKLYEIIAVLDLMFATAIFADLWAHCFHH
jgi:hypothetical protein